MPVYTERLDPIFDEILKKVEAQKALGENGPEYSGSGKKAHGKEWKQLDEELKSLYNHAATIVRQRNNFGKECTVTKCQHHTRASRPENHCGILYCTDFGTEPCPFYKERASAGSKGETA